MGGHLLYNIEFPNRKTRDKFEKKEKKLKRMFQYWCTKEDKRIGIKDYYNCYYYPSWEGYVEPQEILERCKKRGIKIIRFLSNDLSVNSPWFDEIKRVTYVDD